jgi:hypothetical protein
VSTKPFNNSHLCVCSNPFKITCTSLDYYDFSVFVESNESPWGGQMKALWELNL